MVTQELSDMHVPLLLQHWPQCHTCMCMLAEITSAYEEEWQWPLRTQQPGEEERECVGGREEIVLGQGSHSKH